MDSGKKLTLSAGLALKLAEAIEGNMDTCDWSRFETGTMGE